MPQAIILPLAESDLIGIWEYIAQDSSENAARFISHIHQICSETLAFNPQIGRSRGELSEELRSFVVDDHVIFYRPIDDGVMVVRVLHGRRDIEELFDALWRPFHRLFDSP